MSTMCRLNSSQFQLFVLVYLSSPRAPGGLPCPAACPAQAHMRGRSNNTDDMGSVVPFCHHLPWHMENDNIVSLTGQTSMPMTAHNLTNNFDSYP